MIEWTRQGVLVIGKVDLVDSGKGTVVLVGPRQNPKGAIAIISGSKDKQPLANVIPYMSHQDAIRILAMQERCFGDSALESPWEEEVNP